MFAPFWRVSFENSFWGLVVEKLFAVYNFNIAEDLLLTTTVMGLNVYPQQSLVNSQIMIIMIFIKLNTQSLMILLSSFLSSFPD